MQKSPFMKKVYRRRTVVFVPKLAAASSPLFWRLLLYDYCMRFELGHLYRDQNETAAVKALCSAPRDEKSAAPKRGRRSSIIVKWRRMFWGIFRKRKFRG